MSSPSSRPPDLDKVRARLKEANDRLEARTDPKMRRLAPSELAPTIRQQNEARAQRLGSDELATAREEIGRALDYVRFAVNGGALGQSDADLLHASLSEYIKAVAADPGTGRRKAIEAMREAVASMDRMQAKSTVER